VIDGEVLSSLLRQTRLRINEMPGEDAYEQGCVTKLFTSNKLWKKKYGYHKRSLSETMMYLVKTRLGGTLSFKG
jgi:hypothetical protein